MLHCFEKGNNANEIGKVYGKFKAGNVDLEDEEHCSRRVFFNHGYD